MPDQTPLIPDGSVVITPAQQYAELRTLTEAVRDLAGKVDPAIATIREDVIELRTAVTDVRSEVSGLQRWRWMLTGALALLSALLGWGLVNLANIVAK